MFTHMLCSYLAFEVINVSIQKPFILRTHFTQAYWILDTLSPLLLTVNSTDQENFVIK